MRGTLSVPQISLNSYKKFLNSFFQAPKCEIFNRLDFYDILALKSTAHEGCMGGLSGIKTIKIPAIKNLTLRHLNVSAESRCSVAHFKLVCIKWLVSQLER
jgi:hypothetical protein